MPDQSDLDELVQPVRKFFTPYPEESSFIPIPKNSNATLYNALAKAQGQFKQPTLNRTAVVRLKEGGSYTTHYADLNQCIECVRVPLSENGLSFTHTVEKRVEGWLLVLTLRHESGQIESVMPVNPTLTNQQFGGQLTYLKRYQLSAFFGLAADFDDDGNANEGKEADIKPKTPQAQSNSKPPPPAAKPPPKVVDPPKTPEPEDIPQEAPADEFQDQSKPEQKKGPGDYVVAYGSPKWDGKKIKEIGEQDLKDMRTWIETQLKRVPPPKNTSLLFDTKTSINLFFKSVGVQ